MRMLVALAFTLLARPGTALAAPPANDNRADAVPIPAFPHTAAGTTAEATVERLDPQVSRCGRIESTVWYRLDTAPDGLIGITVKGGAGVAPVLRIYRRAASTIQEVDCASAGPGGTASASLEAVRGSNYLVLVGRRPGTADGSFELRAELFLPPPNDDRARSAAPRSERPLTSPRSDSAGSSVASSGTGLRAAATGGFCFASPPLGSSTRRSSSSNASVRGPSEWLAAPPTAAATRPSASRLGRARPI